MIDNSERQPCAVCGFALGPGHGNRRYHPGECASAARKQRQRRNQAAYRARHSSPALPEVPEDFHAGRVTVRSRVVPGSTAAAIQAATLPVLMASLAFHDALKSVPFTDVMNSEQLGRLRYYVDDVVTLIEVLNEVIPAPDIDSDLIDARSGLDIVKTLHINKPRPGAPRRRR